MSVELERRERFRFYELDSEEKRGIVDKLRKALVRRSEVLLAIVYGSFVRGRLVRDVDVAVYVGGGVKSFDYEFKLERELSEGVGIPVDVRVLNDAPPRFVLEVLSWGETLVSRVPGLLEKLYMKALDEKNYVSAVST